MADFDDLDVYLIDFNTGDRLINFDTAKTIAKNSHRQRRHAIEAKPDQRFSIIVDVKKDFDWAGCNALEVLLGFDIGEQVHSRSVYLLKDNMKMQELDLPRLHYDHDRGIHSHRIDHVLVNDEDGDDSAGCHSHFYFRKMRDDIDVKSKSGRPQTFDNQGKIRVEIARVVISVRARSRGLQGDIHPSFRRQTKTNLHQRGITLETVLYTDQANGRSEFKGNFKSDRPEISKHQANFDFIYREIGHHDSFVDVSEIDEVVGVKRGRSSLCEDGLLDEEPATKRQAIREQSMVGDTIVVAPGSPPTTSASVSRAATPAVVHPESNTRQCPANMHHSSAPVNCGTHTTLSFSATATAASQASSLTNSSVDESRSSTPTDMASSQTNLPTREPAGGEANGAAPTQGAATPAGALEGPENHHHDNNAVNGEAQIIMAAQVLDMTAVRHGQQARDRQNLRDQMAEIEIRRRFVQTRIETLRGELQTNMELAVVLDTTHGALQRYHDNIGRMGAAWDERAQTAFNNFCDTMITIFDEHTESRNRNEAGQRNA